MSSHFSAMKGHSGLEGQRRAARVILGLVLTVMTAHLAYFAFGASPSAIEAYYSDPVTGSQVYRALLDVMPGQVPLTERLLSVLCAVIGVIWLSRLCAAWAQDPIVGAVMPLGLVLFPQTAFVFALSTPLAAQMLLTVAGLEAVNKMKMSDAYVPSMYLGSICGLLPFLDVSGFGVGVALIVLAFGDRACPKRLILSVVTGLSIAILMSFLVGVPPMAASVRELVATKAESIADGLGRGFSMLWVALAFSVAALGLSASLRQTIGDAAVRRSIFAGVGFTLSLVWLIGGAGYTASMLPVAFNGVIVLGVVASLPMVMWIRFVMPSITSMWIWILLPVVMYTCFWVILGPINLAGFPYDQVVRQP